VEDHDADIEILAGSCERVHELDDGLGPERVCGTSGSGLIVIFADT